MRTTFAIAFAIVVFWQVITPTSALAVVVIDSFLTPQSATSGVLTRNVADGPGILGDERDVDSFLFLSANGTVPGQLRVAHQHAEPSGRAGASITYDGNDNDPLGGFFGGLGSVDLTQGGLNDRFRLDITSLSSPTGVVRVLVRQVGQASVLEVSLPGGPGVLDLPFAMFQHDLVFPAPANFQEVGYLQFDIELEPGDLLTIDSITAIPEPSTLLLALAGSVLALLSRRRRALNTQG